MRKTHRGRIAAAAGLSFLGAVGAGPAVHAQSTSFPDVPANHWAYQAVQELADKGYVKGYPDGKFLGKRALTRYEFATVVDRMAQTVGDLSTKVKGGQAETPTGTLVTQDDLNKIQVLVDTFQKQLADIQSVTAGAASPFQGQIDALRGQIVQVQKDVAKAQNTADNSFGVGAGRKFQVSGYIQARFTGGPKSQDLYPSGASAVSGGYNGNYSQGGNPDSFEVRRARLKFTGAVTPNTKFAIQIDTSGAITAGTSPNQQVTVREGNIAYTFGDGSAKYPTLTAGLFATPFGYVLPNSMANSLTPERPLAFSESGSYGIFPNQDYDKGAQVSYGLPGARLPLRLTAAFINGNGRSGEENDRHIDQVYHAAYQSQDKTLGVGVSYYNGQLPSAGTGESYQNRRRQLYGADLQYVLPSGPFVLGEYVNGTFEQRTAFNGVSLTPVTAYAPGNRIEGYYAQGGYTFGSAGSHPLTLFVDYDKLRRAASGTGSSDAYDDENVGGGVSYNLDRATRLRVFYIKPSQVAHLPSAAKPPLIAQTTAELQVKF